jgi:predicted Zn-dependent protease
MDSDDRQFLLLAAWMFLRHGQPTRARALCEAVLEEDPRDGAAAAALAQILLDAGEPAAALETLRAGDFPPSLDRAEALLETRALLALGKKAESAARWRRHLEASKGASRSWVKA